MLPRVFGLFDSNDELLATKLELLMTVVYRLSYVWYVVSNFVRAIFRCNLPLDINGDKPP